MTLHNVKVTLKIARLVGMLCFDFITQTKVNK